MVQPGWQAYVDGVLDPQSTPKDVEQALFRIARLSAALCALSPPIALFARSQRRLLVLRMMLTRGLSILRPRRDPLQPLSYSYAPLEPIAGPMLQQDLEGLCRLGMLERGHCERVLVCGSCGDARLQLTRVQDDPGAVDEIQGRCASCGYADLVQELPERLVFSYQLTVEGRGAAICGQLPEGGASE
jgi:hypothetical protein